MTRIEHDLAVALVDGEAMSLSDAKLALTDEGVSRGDGAFETIGVWGGSPFRLEEHLSRLGASLAKCLLPSADTDALRRDVAHALDGVASDAMLRCYVTASGTRAVTLTGQPRRDPVRRLTPQLAPWIVPPAQYGLAGAKTMSYGPNMAATRAAVRAGADDALLLASDGTVLEGPTFCLLWVAAGTVFTVPLARGIVDSISRRTLRELAVAAGYPVEDAEIGLTMLAEADEVAVCSSVRPLTAVTQIGPHSFPGPNPVVGTLAAALESARRTPSA